jgi:hypothetical protein
MARGKMEFRRGSSGDQAGLTNGWSKRYFDNLTAKAFMRPGVRCRNCGRRK